MPKNESVGAVGAVFEEVFFRLGKFLAAFVLAKTVAAAAHAGCLNGEDKVVVILSVEERHKALLSGKTLVDEQILLIVPHGIAEIDSLDSPAVAFKLVDATVSARTKAARNLPRAKKTSSNTAPTAQMLSILSTSAARNFHIETLSLSMFRV